MRPVTVHIWARWWVLGWVAILIVSWLAFLFLPWWWWLIVLTVGFLGPELWAVTHEPSATPPLTSILRRYVKSYLAFPMLGFLVAAPVAYLVTGSPFYILFIGVPAALGFWLIEHFSSTYSRRTPR